MNKITIMIPTYNQEQYIEQCIESALDQEYPNLEIIISDDSTNDETENIVKQKYIQDPRIKYFHNEIRLGRVGNYHHTLYKKATGDYVLNLDGDDWLIDSSYIRRASKILDENDDVVCAMANINIMHSDSGVIDIHSSYSNKTNIIEGTEYLNLNVSKKAHFNHMTSLYRRNLAIKIGFYNVETVWADSQSLFRLIYLGKIAVIDKPVAVWRLHGTNESRSFFLNVIVDELFKSEESVFDFFIKNNENIKNFNARLWLEKWKYEHTKEFIVFHLREENLDRIKELLKYLWSCERFFLFKNIFKLLNDVAIRSSKYIYRKLVVKI